MNEHTTRPSRGDRAGIWIFVVLGAAIVIVTLIWSIRRILSIASDSPVDLLAKFADTTGNVSLNAGSELLPVKVESAYVTATSLSPSTLGPAILEPIITLLAVTTVIVCLTILALHILRGSVFGRTQTRCVITASMTGLVGFALAPVFGNLAASDAIFTLTGQSSEVALFAVSPIPFLVGGFAVSIAITAFAVGERMQRDQEGLI